MAPHRPSPQHLIDVTKEGTEGRWPRIEPAGQWQLQQDSVDGGIGIELFDQGEQLRLARRRGKVVLDRMKPAGLRGLALGFDIDLTCRIVADKRRPGFSPCAASAGIFRHLRIHVLRRALTVDHKSLRAGWKEDAVSAGRCPGLR
jgi:hypothetical protein